jgi:SsrA-binding protein
VSDEKAKRPITANRRARHEFELLDELECGLALTGTEVKSLRQGRASIAEAYCMIRRGELWLCGSHFPEYSHGTCNNHAPTRERKLLAHRREIARWDKQVREKGITIVPLELYFSGSRVKLAIALCRGKKLHDKRQAERERMDRREVERVQRRRR